jgi:hypothetical protein
MDIPDTTTPPGAPSVVPQNQQLSRNPALPQHPLGAYTDAQYEADVASLRNEVSKKYADVLQRLGYVDPQSGQFIMGSVETEAGRQKGLLNRSMDLAREDVTHQHQQQGTLFSGLRGTNQARAEFPFVNQIGDVERQLPLTLSDLYEQGAGLSGEFNIKDNQLLAQAAGRRAAGLSTSPPGDVTPPPAADATAAAVVPPPPQAPPDTPIPGMIQVPQAPTPAAAGPLLQGPDARMAHAFNSTTIPVPPPNPLAGGPAAMAAQGLGMVLGTPAVAAAAQRRLMPTNPWA